ncbi:hypothetical protein M514_18582 [Trichuris suis]|uniref:Uncharacterized protein n=1 Tax=Trichuris suis TaxID=68888 RepID=A0A085NIB7_9BILA|nr:hypothetical protein M514_18582 [Trichuris suis]
MLQKGIKWRTSLQQKLDAVTLQEVLDDVQFPSHFPVKVAAQFNMPAKRFASEEEMRERLSRISLDEPSVSRRSHCARMDPSTSFRTFDQMESRALSC